MEMKRIYKKFLPSFLFHSLFCPRTRKGIKGEQNEKQVRDWLSEHSLTAKIHLPKTLFSLSSTVSCKSEILRWLSLSWKTRRTTCHPLYSPWMSSALVDHWKAFTRAASVKQLQPFTFASTLTLHHPPFSRYSRRSFLRQNQYTRQF